MPLSAKYLFYDAMILSSYFQLKDHSLKTFAKFPEKLTSLIP